MTGERERANSGTVSNLFRGPRTLSVQPTLQCSAECTNCGTFSSPREKAHISLESIVSSIKQAKELGFFNVVFTGGEATIHWTTLLRGIEYARSLGFPTRLVTNAYWAKTIEKATNRIEALITVGLNEINFSTGDEHCRFVPLNYVVNAAVAAMSQGLNTHIVVELRAQRQVTRDIVMNCIALRELPEVDLKRLTVVESPWMPVDPSQVEIYPDGVAVNSRNIDRQTGCDSVLQTYVIQGNGLIGACCGLGLRMLPELNVACISDGDFLREAIVEAESDFLKLWIHTHGPEKIVAWASEKDPSINWEDMYAHRCQACMRLYQDPKIRVVIQKYHNEMFLEVFQAHWLESEFAPVRLEKSTVASPGIQQ